MSFPRRSLRLVFRSFCQTLTVKTLIFFQISSKKKDSFKLVRLITGTTTATALKSKRIRLYLRVCKTIIVFTTSRRQGGDMLPGDTPSEGHGGAADQKIQESRDAGHRRRRQRRVDDQGGAHRGGHYRPGG